MNEDFKWRNLQIYWEVFIYIFLNSDALVDAAKVYEKIN